MLVRGRRSVGLLGYEGPERKSERDHEVILPQTDFVMARDVVRAASEVGEYEMRWAG